MWPCSDPWTCVGCDPPSPCDSWDRFQHPHDLERNAKWWDSGCADDGWMVYSRILSLRKNLLRLSERAEIDQFNTYHWLFTGTSVTIFLPNVVNSHSHIPSEPKPYITRCSCAIPACFTSHILFCPFCSTSDCALSSPRPSPKWQDQVLIIKLAFY